MSAPRHRTCRTCHKALLAPSTTPRARSRGLLVEPQLDRVAVGILHIETRRVPLRPKETVGASRAREPGGECVEIGRLDHKAEVIHVLARPLGREEADEGLGRDPDRREQHLPGTPPLDPPPFHLTLLPVA